MKTRVIVKWSSRNPKKRRGHDWTKGQKVIYLSDSSEWIESTGIDFIELKIGFSPPRVSAFEPAIIAEITDAFEPTAEGKVTVWTGRLFAFFPSWLNEDFS